jgi:hypothetical protein
MSTHVIADPATAPALPPAAAGWDALSAALTDEAPVIADRDDLIVTIAPDAAHGHPAVFLPHSAATAIVVADIGSGSVGESEDDHPAAGVPIQPHVADGRVTAVDLSGDESSGEFGDALFPYAPAGQVVCPRQLGAQRVDRAVGSAGGIAPHDGRLLSRWGCQRGIRCGPPVAAGAPGAA